MTRVARRTLPPPRRMTGLERRWLNPQRGFLKVIERATDRLFSRHVYPHLAGIWSPYSWLLPRRFSLAEASLAPPLWPVSLGRLTILHVSDIHTGAFYRPGVLEAVLGDLMALSPDLVAVTGDIVEARASDVEGFLDELAVLAGAPLGAWYCHGNHDYYGGESERIRQGLASVGIRTLRNESVVISHAEARFVLGGIDDRILGTPDWDKMVAEHGAPHLLLAHHPDDFYEAARRGMAVVLSGHTHGGQIRFAGGRPIVRHSEFRLDEGLFVHDQTMLVVSRGLGAVGIPWRHGADPEAVWIEIVCPPSNG